jgi:hypothetical protein
VAIQLRQEVGFACPVCGSPVLTYHHFDPPWNERQHNDPKGMIALCPDDHGRADAGTWTKDELRKLKRQPWKYQRIEEKFFWAEHDRRILYRLGTNYATSHRTIIAIGGHPILWEERTGDGRSLFSLEIFDNAGKQLLQIVQNTVSVESLNLWDVRFKKGASGLVVATTQGNVALDLRFRRCAPDELQEILDADADVTATALKKGQLTFPGLSISPDGSQMIKNAILDYATKNCLDSDQKIPLIDLQEAQLHGRGSRLVSIKRGVLLTGGGALGMNFVADNQGGAFGF